MASEEQIPVDNWPTEKTKTPEEELESRRKFYSETFEWAKSSIPPDVRTWITFERHYPDMIAFVFDRQYSDSKPKYVIGMQQDDIGRLAAMLPHEGLSFRGISDEQVDIFIDGRPPEEIDWNR